MTKVGVFYDAQMLEHCNTADGEYKEKPERCLRIYNKLLKECMDNRCTIFRGTLANECDIKLVHEDWYVTELKDVIEGKLTKPSRYNSIYVVHPGTWIAATVSAGTVVKASQEVMTSMLKSAVAIVRPPGHHAEATKAFGFCFFNNVAIAARVLLRDKLASKIAIIDWDIHHGNGTQKAFWDERNVLYFSVHRKDLFPYENGGKGGDCHKIGGSNARGYNINVPWTGGGFGDNDYILIWDQILIPVLDDYNPDVIIVSAGFDSAAGDDMGDCKITPFGFFTMTEKLMKFANGRIILCLEGGYNLDATEDSMFACVNALVGVKYKDIESRVSIPPSRDPPLPETKTVIAQVIAHVQDYWPSLREHVTQEPMSRNHASKPLARATRAKNKERMVNNTTEALAHSILAKKKDKVYAPKVSSRLSSASEKKPAAKKPIEEKKGAEKGMAEKAGRKYPKAGRPSALGVKKKRFKKNVTYKIYIRKVLKQVHPDISINRFAIETMNSFMNDMFERLFEEALDLACQIKKRTITTREIQSAAFLVLPRELAKGAILEGKKAVAKFAEYSDVN